MPLSCDCYGGCWGDHSKDWPSVVIPPGMETAAAMQLTHSIVPYGSYVLMGTTVRTETGEYHERLRMAFAKFQYGEPSPTPQHPIHNSRPAVRSGYRVWETGCDQWYITVVCRPGEEPLTFTGTTREEVEGKMESHGFILIGPVGAQDYAGPEREKFSN